jgi:uncharacterized GH25 family protein
MISKMPRVLLLLLLVPATLHAHDFWIEPSTFRPEVGSTVQVRLRVGQNFVGDPVPRAAAIIERFMVSTAKGVKDVAGTEGADPAGTIRIDSPGLMTIAYRSRNKFVDLNPLKQEQYIEENGLERIRELREQMGETYKPWHENFSRCAKALLLTRGAKKIDRDRPIGLRLELIAEKNPYRLHKGARLPVRLVFEGKPLAGALVQALHENDPATHIRVRSDANGRVDLTLPSSGNWLIEAVHMVRATPGGQADWESMWASLTFRLED